ncbi:MAG: gamma-glutamyl-gamma-aminobutyrate hydrolase family protein, partial [Thermoanaerobaculia bacterium]|nr:gamma-glutamyl-gamma-aminobutyrate hydrolase family protein [Thermoanaerobaculia bacterium]
MDRESGVRSESASGASPRRRRPLGGWLAIAAVLALAILLAWPAGEREGPMIVVSIDRTLWHRLGLTRFTYLRALRRAGAESRVVNAEGFSEGGEPARLARRLLRDADGLLLTGGGDVDPDLYAGDPGLGRGVKEERDRLELALLDEATRRGLPLLAICR